MREKPSRQRLRSFISLVGIAVVCLAAAMPSRAQSRPPRRGDSQKVKSKIKDRTSKIDAAVPVIAPPGPRYLSVVKIDAAKLAEYLPRAGEPPEDGRAVLVNFWATWCEPCRDEYPDLVKINDEFFERGLTSFTVSLDDPGEIETTVPAFLREMKAFRLPAYLLDTPEPADAINLVDPTWSGALPATFLFDRRGKLVYKHTGRFDPAELRAAIKNAMEANGK